MTTDWIAMKETKERLDGAILPFDEMAMIIGSVEGYLQFKPDQKEFLATAVEKLKRQRQSCMNIVYLGTVVNANLKECVLTIKEIEGLNRAFLFNKAIADNIEWGKRAVGVSDHMSGMNKCFKEMVKLIVNEELKDPDEEVAV